MSHSYHLKKIQPNDIHHIHKGLSNPEITRYYDVHYSTLEETQSQMDWYAELERTGAGQWWGIYDEADQFCGAGGFSDREFPNFKAEIGLWVIPEYWGKGVTKAALELLFEKGFYELKLNRIEAYVESKNIFCKNALSKVYFPHEATMKEYEFKNGEFLDYELYGITKKDWENKK